jgi:hypothetical protein
MKQLLTLTLALLLMGALQGSARGGDDTYFPYSFYDEYYRQQQAPPPAAPQGETPRPAPAQASRAPLFLFPPELGFGVAVATSEDLFYLHESFYRVSGGSWYRSGSYRGPWIPAPRGKLPPELLKHRLPETRALRDREFRRFWEEKSAYQGQAFRPASAERKRDGRRPD